MNNRLEELLLSSSVEADHKLEQLQHTSLSDNLHQPQPRDHPWALSCSHENCQSSSSSSSSIINIPNSTISNTDSITPADFTPLSLSPTTTKTTSSTTSSKTATAATTKKSKKKNKMKQKRKKKKKNVTEQEEMMVLKQQFEELKQETMRNFFQHVQSTKDGIETISQTSRRIKYMEVDGTLLAVSEKEERVMSQEIKLLIQETNVKAKEVKCILNLLKKECDRCEAEEVVVSVSDLRKCKNIINTLTRKFIDEMKGYQNAQQSYKATVKKKAIKQIKYVKEDVTPEEVEQIMRSEGGREELFQQNILRDGVNDKIKQTYTKVAGKYQDILALEQSVAELHQIFLDFALLTEQQGELIDQIEFNVKRAVDYVEEGNELLYDSILLARKNRCIIM